MIHRNHGDISFECDTCGELFDTNFHDWVAAWNLAKREGWRSKKVNNEWEHVCPECENRS